MHGHPVDVRPDPEPLLAGVAHDFANLSAVVGGYLSLAMRKVDDPTVLDLLERAHAAAARGTTMAQQLYDLAQCGAIEREPVVLHDVVTGAAGLLTQALAPGCQLELDLADEPFEVIANRDGLELVLLQLVRNACDAMPDGGTISVATRRGTDPARPGEVVVSVSDEGAGITPEVAARALEPRFTTRGKAEHNGLGLAIVERALTRFGGRVTIAPSPVGATVRLHLADVLTGG